ncbi:hypothetical protein AN1V17_38930 [Vallitalea sediminicola]
MKCFYHPDRDGQYKCTKCGKIICAECTCFDGNKTLCEECYESIKATNVNYSYNRFWAFVFSLIPGTGRMYLGFMEQGLLMMLAFFGVITLANTIPYMPIGILVVWFYSFFDVYHLKKKIDNNEVIIDKPIFDIKIKKSYVAYGLIILGGVILINEILGNFYFRALTYNERKLIRSFFVPIILIIVGIILLKQVKKSVQTNDDNGEKKYKEDFKDDNRYTYDNVDKGYVENDITIENEDVEPEINKNFVENNYEIENEIEIEN